MMFKLPVALLSLVACLVLANAIPADPTITPAAILPRQLAADWIGYVKDPEAGTWTSQSCDAGGTWYRSGSYGQCCPDTVTACPAPTACVGGSQIYPLESTTITIACTSNYNNATYSICNTALIFESFGDPHPITDIICGDKSQAWSFYREVPASVTQSSSPTASPDSDGGSGSKAWIAGAVVGPIIGIALIAGIVFFLMRRKKNKQNNPQQTGGVAMGPPSGVQQYTDAKPQLNTNTSYGQAPPGVDTSYNQQAYSQGYAQQPTSPAPQFQQPYAAPASPPPQSPQSAYAAQEAKFGYTTQPPSQPNAAELGGVSSPAGGQYTAELSSDPRRT